MKELRKGCVTRKCGHALPHKENQGVWFAVVVYLGVRVLEGFVFRASGVGPGRLVCVPSFVPGASPVSPCTGVASQQRCFTYRWRCVISLANILRISSESVYGVERV